MSLQENKALVRRYVEEVQSQHNLAAIDELFRPIFSTTAAFPTHPPLRTKMALTALFAGS
jgi:hypothetical protein